MNGAPIRSLILLFDHSFFLKVTKFLLVRPFYLKSARLSTYNNLHDYKPGVARLFFSRAKFEKSLFGEGLKI